MNEIVDYTQITTVAVVILVIMQLVVLLIVGVVATKTYLLVKRVSATAKISKEFVSDLRQQQIKNVSLVQLGLFALRRVKKLRK
jgi:ABC-type multidrug transport system fused ATPase/permease subunit